MKQTYQPMTMTKQELSELPEVKTATIQKAVLTDKALERINSLSLKEVSTNDVVTFKFAMCDNNLDRHYDHFTQKALRSFVNKYVGVAFIKDHDTQSVDKQIGRIYHTELVSDNTKLTEFGEPYTQAIAHVYLANTAENKSLINDIELGIKKEVSVGFRMGKGMTKCSICGKDYYNDCSHWKGYSTDEDGNVCTIEISDIHEGLELSLVSVPAQPLAGAIKAVEEPVVPVEQPTSTEANSEEKSASDDENTEFVITEEVMDTLAGMSKDRRRISLVNLGLEPSQIAEIMIETNNR